MTRPNKLEHLSLAILSRLVYYLKVRPEPSQVGTLYWQVPDLTHKYKTRLEKFVRAKRFSLFGLFVDDEGNFFLN
jgi:hypothetical protein